LRSCTRDRSRHRALLRALNVPRAVLTQYLLCLIETISGVHQYESIAAVLVLAVPISA